MNIAKHFQRRRLVPYGTDENPAQSAENARKIAAMHDAPAPKVVPIAAGIDRDKAERQRADLASERQANATLTRQINAMVRELDRAVTERDEYARALEEFRAAYEAEQACRPDPAEIENNAYARGRKDAREELAFALDGVAEQLRSEEEQGH